MSGSDNENEDDNGSNCSTVTVMMVPTYIDMMSFAGDGEDTEGEGEIGTEPSVTLVILEEELDFMYNKVLDGMESLRSAMGLLEELKRRHALR